ncbi:MAG: phosphate uptake regulator PhoU [Candidatus Bathyarchaeota archaeon]|nr:phosphate uptake regulator PhoU [Candidatus Bathyarchaeota archaeon]
MLLAEGMEREGLVQAKQDEETRKIQFTGGSTYIISLPKKWIASNQLKKGSFIKLREEQGGLLTIGPPAAAVQKKTGEVVIKVSASDSTEMITRKIIAVYLAGHNTLQIRPVKPDKQALSTKQRYEIKNFVRRMLVGTEIVTDTSHQLSLQVLLSYPELTVQSALRRMSIIATSMHKEALSGLKTNDYQLAKEIISTDNEVDRFNLYVNRLLKLAIQNPRVSKEIGLENDRDCLSYRLVTTSVERTADHAVKIAENILVLKKGLNPDVLEKIDKMGNIAITMFTIAMEALFRQDYNMAEKIMENINEVVSLEHDAISAQVDIEDVATLRLIIESIRRTAEYSCDIAEIVLNLTVDSILG